MTRTRACLASRSWPTPSNAPLTTENIGTCDLVLVCVRPEAAVEYLRAGRAAHRRESPSSSTAAARSASSARRASRWRKEYRLHLSRRPPDGRHAQLGLQIRKKQSLSRRAHGASFPRSLTTLSSLQRAKDLLQPAGFGKFSVTTAEAHDEMIAFTSQLAHVVSNAYIKSPTAGSHKGFSAGSYKDMTRVAWLNAPMWAELFLENRDYMLAGAGRSDGQPERVPQGRIAEAGCA